MSLQEMGKKIRKSLKRRYCDIVTGFINFHLPDDPVHSLKETIQLFAMAGIRNSYVTTVSRDMKAAGHYCQTGETAMDRIGPLLSSALFEEGCKANDHIIKNAVEREELKPEIFTAVDTHLVYRNTKIPIGRRLRKRFCSDILTVIGSKPKNGACYAHEYMTLQNIKMKDEPTYVLAFDRVLPLRNRTKIMKQLIEETESKTNSIIKLIVADGGFDDVNTMKMVLKKEKHFVFRADKDKKVKDIVDAAEKNDRNYQVVYNYVKGNKKHNVMVNLVVLKVDWLKKQGIKYPLVKTKYLTFFTDLSHNERVSLESYCLKVALYYKKRWGIETGYRDIGAFEAQTHSLHDATRLFLYIQAIILFNLWIQINLEFKDDPDRIKHFRDGIPKSTIKFIMEQMTLDENKEEMEQGPLKN
ncbi:MAG: transposase [Candidatus Thermoplasmatota archaeon]|nr:transposase [Candidatus Thermoplasmatota archaeon]